MGKFITIRVNMMSNTSYEGDQDPRTQECLMKVNIDDKVSKIFKYGAIGLSQDKINGFISTKTKLIDDPDEITFHKLASKSNQLFSLAFPEEGEKEPMRWVRFKEYRTTDYFYLNSHYWDACVFIPKRDVTFFGFGIFGNYH